MTRSLTQWCDTPLLQERAHCSEVDTMKLSTTVQPCMYVTWTTPICQNACCGQSVQTLGIVLPTHPRNNGKTRSLLTSRHISPGASTVTPSRVVVWYDICLHCRATATDMTAERGAWLGLWYDIKRRRDDSSERAHPDATIADGWVPIWSGLVTGKVKTSLLQQSPDLA